MKENGVVCQTARGAIYGSICVCINRERYVPERYE